MPDLQHVAWRAENGVGHLTLQRPPLNVLNIEMLAELRAVLDVAAAETTLRALVLQAEGKMFSAGVDVADHTADKVGEMIPLFHTVCHTLAEFSVPTVAAVQGHALGGGCELALCCDLIFAADHARLGQPEIKLATFPPIAALRLPPSIGYRRAAEMIFTGEPISAPDAEQAGMINRAVPADDLHATVDRVVGQLGELSASALRICKQALVRSYNGWEALPDVERLYLDDLMALDDTGEGLAAFLEKRAPVWNHT